MSRKIFVNLPIENMQRSRAFYEALGFSFNPQFTNEQGACMVVGDDIYVMLLVKPFFQTFTGKPIADASKSTEVLVCLSCGSKQEVDGLVASAGENGGKAVREAMDHGFMYQHAFEDPDGHIWELVHMKGQP